MRPGKASPSQPATQMPQSTICIDVAVAQLRPEVRNQGGQVTEAVCLVETRAKMPRTLMLPNPMRPTACAAHQTGFAEHADSSYHREDGFSSIAWSQEKNNCLTAAQ